MKVSQFTKLESYSFEQTFRKILFPLESQTIITIIIIILIILLNETLLKVVKAQLQRKAFKQLKVEKEQISKKNLFYNKNI